MRSSLQLQTDAEHEDRLSLAAWSYKALLSFRAFLYHRRVQKLYCYVDETGQNAASNIFVVVAVVSAREQEPLRQALLEIEDLAVTGRRK